MYHLNKILSSHYVLMVLVGIVALGVYLNSLPNGFVRDDKLIIRDNPMIRDPGKLGELMKTNYWRAKGVNAGTYRPVTMVSYTLNYYISGLNPRGYHAVNIIIHCGITILVYVLLRLLTGTASVAFWGSLVFAVHPVHVEAVANIVGRADLLAAFMILSALFMHRSAAAAEGWRRVCFCVSAAVIFMAGLLSKENAITFLALPPLHDFVFSRREHGSTRRTYWTARIIMYCVYGTAALSYLILRKLVIGATIDVNIPYQANPLAYVSTGTRMMSAMGLVSRYIWLFLYPRILQCDYSVNVIQPVPSIMDPFFLAGFSLCFLIVSVFIRELYKRSALSFFIGFALFTYLLVSNIFIPVTTIMGERLFYLPSVGMCAIAGICIAQALNFCNKHGRGFHIAGVLLVSFAIILLGWRTVIRNTVWASDRTLYLTDVKAAPECAKLQANAGWIHLNENNNEKAIQYLTASMRIYQTPEALFTLGRAYGAHGDEKRRRQIYRLTAEEYPLTFWGLSAKAWISVWEQRYQDACRYFETALELRPFDGTTRYNLGILYLELGQIDKAVQELENAHGLKDKSERIRVRSLEKARNLMLEK